MGKKKLTYAYIFGNQYKQLSRVVICEELSSAKETVFDISPRVEENGKLHPKEVYVKILQGLFFISEPEKTKSVRVVVSPCWTRDVKLLVEREEDDKFVFTG